MPTVGEQLVRLLEQRGVTHVFGIPGAHTIELYRGLSSRPVQHVSPRHEQGAGFMADGYARASGKPGVAFVITGPGLLNIATAMAQSYADSIPMLVISSVNALTYLGMGGGNLHEMKNQSAVASSCCAFSHTLTGPAQLESVIDKAFAVFDGGRPRPVHLEIPVDILSAPASEIAKSAPAKLVRGAPASSTLNLAAAALNRSAKTVILCGGGARNASEEIGSLAELLDAPVIMTTNGRGCLGDRHPLAVPASPSLRAVRNAVKEADVVFALGTEFATTDYDMYERDPFRVPGTLIRVDIDPEQIHRGCKSDIALLADVAESLRQLLPLLERKSVRGKIVAKEIRKRAITELAPDMRRDLGVLGMIRQYFPVEPLVGDSTHIVYAGNLYWDAPRPAAWFNSAVGFGTLGYAPPAAIGASIATGKPVVCLVGDGGLQFTLAELIVTIEESAPVLFIVFDNQGYGEIESYMQSSSFPPFGVKLRTPDFTAVAKAMGLSASRPSTLVEFENELRLASENPVPRLIVLDDAVNRTAPEYTLDED